jgi:hypothetical protein
LGRDWAESFGYEKALIRFDIMLQDDDEMKYKDWDGAYSLVSKWQKGKFNLWTDLSLANTCFVTQICRDIGMAVVPSKKNLH